MLRLEAGDYRLLLDPGRGGSICAFEWRGEPLLRETCGPSILDVACFPLVPFSNRIANGRFESPRGPVQLRPNFPDSDHPHTLHGFGWLSEWEVVEAYAERATLRHVYPEAEWPWSYVAEQRFTLLRHHLVHELSVRNLSSAAMPAGLGFHPYFPRTDQTLYYGAHKGEWQTGEDGLPVTLIERDEAIDWWDGRAISERAVDTVYVKRSGPLVVRWPERELELKITPSLNLPFTVVYTPAARDFFCVEPVTHATNAFNSESAGALHWLPPGEIRTCRVNYRAYGVSFGRSDH